MEYTKDDINNLKEWIDIIDSDDIKIKQTIKDKLLNNKDIIHLLHNKELEDNDAEPDDYFNVNIYPYYMVPNVETKERVILCYETSFDELNRYNSAVKYQQIIFYILCHKGDIIQEDTYLPRHDLMAALLMREFNYSNYFGRQIHCISNKPSTTDNDYATRTLIFEQKPDANVVTTMKGAPMITNKDIRV